MDNNQENQSWQIINNSNEDEFTPVPIGMLDGLFSNFLILNNSHRNLGEVAHQPGTVIHLQLMDSYLHAFVLAIGYSNGYGRVLLIPLQSPLFHGNGHHHFLSSSNTTMGEMNLTPSFQHVTDFLRAMQVDLGINNVISITDPQIVWSHFHEIAIEVATPFYDQSYALGNIEHDLQLGMRNHSNIGPATFNFMNYQIADFYENFANHYEYMFPLGNFYLSNFTSWWTLQSNMYEYGVGMASRIMNNPISDDIAFQRQSIQIPNYTYVNPYIDSSITMVQPNFASRPEVHGGGYSRTDFISSLPPSNYETRSEMVAPYPQVRSALNHSAYDELFALVTGQIEGILIRGNNSPGLSEDRVMMHIWRGHFECVEDDETIDNIEACCMCLEEFANGEEVGELSCMHNNFHVECIRNWLMRRNMCPICREVTLAVNE